MFLRTGFRSAQTLRNTLPLRAMTSSFSTAVPKIDSIPGDQEGDVLFHTKYGVRTIELNRPDKYNALDGSMCRKIVPRLLEWDKSKLANVVVVKGAGKAFCAGGDVKTLAQLVKTNGPEGVKKACDYFALEYRLDHLIAMYNKPYVAFMDGYTLGGGVGLSIHAPFRIATENTRFGMPETRIGFFPDVGGSFFLPRMDGEIGTYLALTSEQLHGVANLYAGVATHYMHSTALPDLEERLGELQFEDTENYVTKLRLVDAAIKEFATGLPPSEPTIISGETRKTIDRCFRFNSVYAIIQALEKEGTEWATKTRDTILQRSPTSLVVTLHMLRQGKKHSISDAFQREHILASHFMNHPDFVEGVTAQLGKPTREPKWSPAEIPKTAEENQAIIDQFFTLKGQERLKLLVTGVDYNNYQYPSTGLPSEAEVKMVVQRGGKTAKEIVDGFINDRQVKEGMREKVYDILERKTETVEGALVWIDGARAQL